MWLSIKHNACSKEIFLKGIPVIVACSFSLLSTILKIDQLG